MHTDRTNKSQSTLPSRRLWAHLLGLSTFNPTLATPILFKYEPFDNVETQTSHLSTREDNLKNLPRETSSSDLALDQSNPNNRNDVGAIVGGTIAAGILLGFALFVSFKIYRECLLRRRSAAKSKQQQQKNRTPTPTGTNENSDGYRDMLPGIRRSVGNYGQRLGRWRNRREYDRVRTNSGLEFGDLTATPPIGRTEPIAGPLVPPKAAGRLGIEPNVPGPRLPRMAVPGSTTPIQETPTSSQLYYPPVHERYSRSSSCSMSTLGRELHDDTMLPPAPSKYSISPILNRALPPTPPTPQTVTEVSPWTRGSARRYFAPERLQTPSPPDLTMRIENLDFQRDRYKGTRYSMGSNVV